MHADGFHKNEETKARCWGCSHPEMFASTVDDETFARKLVEDGFYQTSNKYRGVARMLVPKFEDALTVYPEVPEWLHQELKRWRERGIRGGFPGASRESEEHLELTPGQFFAFKRLTRVDWRAILDGAR